MKATRPLVVATLIVATALALQTGQAQAAQMTRTTRTDLQRSDLSTPGREAIQVLVKFAPGVVAPRH
jgi:hypothetical protein